MMLGLGPRNGLRRERSFCRQITKCIGFIGDPYFVVTLKKEAEADALRPGPEKRRLQKEANSYRVLANAKSWLKGDLEPPI